MAIICFSVGGKAGEVIELKEERPRALGRIVVLGGGGFIGEVVMRRLCSLGIDAVSVTRSNVDLESVNAPTFLAKIFEKADGVVNTAGVVPVRNAKSFNRAILIAENISRALSMLPLRCFVNISSDSVYPESCDVIDETTLCGPSTLYGMSHLARELIFAEISKDVSVTNIRPTLLFGYGNDKAGYGFDAFLRQAIAGGPIRVYGDGSEIRDYIWAEDVAEMVVACLRQQARGSIIAASGVSLRFAEVAKFTAAYWDVGIESAERPADSRSHPSVRIFRNDSTFRVFPNFRYTSPYEAFTQIHESFQKGRGGAPS